MNKLITIILLISITGCGTSYQSDSWTGGYTEIQLSDNVYKVGFRGNGYTSRSRVENFTLLRCAELTLEKGYRYFVIIDGKTSSSSSTMTTPTTTYTNATVNGNSISGSSTTYGGQSYNVVKASGTNTIAMLHTKPEKQFVYNASMIFKNLKRKYDID